VVWDCVIASVVIVFIQIFFCVCDLRVTCVCTYISSELCKIRAFLSGLPGTMITNTIRCRDASVHHRTAPNKLCRLEET
jgi:hypothetical protein